MHTTVARFKITPGKEAEAEAAIQKQAAAVQAQEPGALAYIFHRNRKDPSEILVFEIYADDDAVQTHRGSPHMAEFGALFGSVFDAASVKIERFERLAGFNRGA
jgi:quinol monooxygenase YgiN